MVKHKQTNKNQKSCTIDMNVIFWIWCLLFHSCGHTIFSLCLEVKINEHYCWCYISNWQDMKGTLLQREGTQGLWHDPAQTFKQVQKLWRKRGNTWIPIKHSDLAHIVNRSKRIWAHPICSQWEGIKNATQQSKTSTGWLNLPSHSIGYLLRWLRWT